MKIWEMTNEDFFRALHMIANRPVNRRIMIYITAFVFLIALQFPIYTTFMNQGGTPPHQLTLKDASFSAVQFYEYEFNVTSIQIVTLTMSTETATFAIMSDLGTLYGPAAGGETGFSIYVVKFNANDKSSNEFIVTIPYMSVTFGNDPNGSSFSTYGLYESPTYSNSNDTILKFTFEFQLNQIFGYNTSTGSIYTTTCTASMVFAVEPEISPLVQGNSAYLEFSKEVIIHGVWQT